MTTRRVGICTETPEVTVNVSKLGTQIFAPNGAMAFKVGEEKYIHLPQKGRNSVPDTDPTPSPRLRTPILISPYPRMRRVVERTKHIIPAAVTIGGAYCADCQNTLTREGDVRRRRCHCARRECPWLRLHEDPKAGNVLTILGYWSSTECRVISVYVPGLDSVS